jgi:cytochrome c peroxidase
MRSRLTVFKLLLGAACTLFAAWFSLPASSTSSAEPAAYVFAAIDFAPAPGEAERNRQELVKLIAEAARRGARYVVTPELGISGAYADGAQPARGRPNAEPIPGPTTDYFARQARELRIWLALSLPEKAEGGGYYLTTVLLDESGQVAARNRKVMVRPEAGDGPANAGDYRDVLDTVDTGGVRLGVLSGDDIQAGIPRLAARGADTILVTAGWSVQEAARWDEEIRRLSKEYGVNLVVANRRGAAVAGEAAPSGGIYMRSGEVLSPGAGAVSGLAQAALRQPAGRWRIETPLGLPSVPLPTYQAGNPEIAELGRKLFFDTNLSSTKTVSCATCHMPDRAFANGKPKGIGVHGRLTKRNVPSLLNVAYRPLLQWDGYAGTLENFAKYPLSGYTEMDFHYLDEAIDYLRSRPDYVKAFQSVMGVDPIEFEAVATALATYQRTLLSANSPFDRYYYGRDEAALSAEAKRGLKLFQGTAKCSTCHLIGDRYALFTDFKYHSVGVGYDTKGKTDTDVGLGGISFNDNNGLFLTPSLRNVAETGPYMHDGSMRTLEEIVEFYDRGGGLSPNRDPRLKPLSLSRQEKKDLLAFLRSLTGDQQYSAEGVRLNGPTPSRPLTPPAR